MRHTVDTVIEDGRWQDFGLAELAETSVRAALGSLGMAPEEYSLVLMGCDDARIASLNGDFRAKAAPTNVLSWPSDERAAARDGDLPERPEPGTPNDPEELGDIAIAYETCAREAGAQGKSFRDHVAHLIVHGTLHLLGYDHIRDGDAAVMEAREVAILAKLGIADPYE